MKLIPLLVKKKPSLHLIKNCHPKRLPPCFKVSSTTPSTVTFFNCRCLCRTAGKWCFNLSTGKRVACTSAKCQGKRLLLLVLKAKLVWKLFVSIFFITQFGNVALTQLVGVRRSVVFLHNLLDYDGDFIYMKVIWQRCYIQKCSSKANYLFNRLASI